MPGLNDVADVTLDVGGHIAGAAAILALGYILAKVIQRIVRRLLSGPEISNALGPSIIHLIRSAAFYLVLALAVGLALIALGVSATLVSTGALILIAIVAIALRESIANFAATVNFLMFQPFKRGELIETMGQTGIVREILLFSTVLHLLDERLVTLPNSRIQESGIINYTRMGRICADVSLTIGYGADLCQVRSLVTDIVMADARILPTPPCEFIVDALADDGVRLLIRPMVAPGDYWNVQSDLRERIKQRFDAAGIPFATSRHDIHLTPNTTSPITPPA